MRTVNARNEVLWPTSLSRNAQKYLKKTRDKFISPSPFYRSCSLVIVNKGESGMPEKTNMEGVAQYSTVKTWQGGK